MSWKISCLCLFGAAAVLLSAGCESDLAYEITNPKPGEVSSFLPHHELLAKQPAKSPFQYFYMRKDAPRYANVYVAPVDVSHLKKSVNWAKLDKDMASKLGTDIPKLADFMRSCYAKEIRQYPVSEKPNVVESPKFGNTAIMKTAIIAIVPTKAELNALGLAGNIFLPGISALAARLAAGSIALECKVVDGSSNEILFMYSTVINDQAAVLNLQCLSWYGSAQRNIEKAAKDTARVLITRDYRSIKRDTPIKLISR